MLGFRAVLDIFQRPIWAKNVGAPKQLSSKGNWECNLSQKEITAEVGEESQWAKRLVLSSLRGQSLS
jgi:hypothetical protein